MSNQERERFKKPQFKIKAIETKYDSYRFRSRLEARWAVFFNTLNISYIYEMEGFVLEGTPYLPDFFLPQHDCFVEIKGVEPTDDELRKARLLCLYSMKCVYLFSGEVGRDKHGLSAYKFIPPALGTWSSSGPIQDKDAPPEVFWTLQRLSDAEFTVALNNQKNDITLDPNKTWGYTSTFDPEVDSTWDDIFWFLAERGRSLVAAMDLLRKHRMSVMETLKPGPGEDEWVWVDIREWFNCAWGECTKCSSLTIAHDDEYYHHPCGCHAAVNYNAPRILSAYQAAREARFERQ